MPSAAIRWDGSPSMRSPPRTMRPRVGRKSPEMTLSSVVFPAPLGPMSPCTSPGATWTAAPSSARTPPKLRSTSSTESSTRGLPHPPLAQRARQRDDAVREEEDHRQQDGAVEEQPERARREAQRAAGAAQRLGEHGEERGAGHGAVEHRVAADLFVDDGVHRAREAVAVGATMYVRW